MEKVNALPVRIDNETGEQIYSMDFMVDCHRRLHTQPEGEQENEEQDSDDLNDGVPLENASSPNGESGSNNEDGLIRDRWRIISAVEAWPQGDFFLPQMVDYSHNYGKVIRQVAQHINEKHPDLMWDHSFSSRDIAGFVENAAWEKSKDIPSGVNADLVVDPEVDPHAAISLEKKTLRNGSVGLTMELRKSHPKMDFGEFVEKQGKVVDGQKVRWLPHALKAVRHMAFVPAGAGADPYAGRRLMSSRDEHIEAPNKNNTEEALMDEHIDLLNRVIERLGLDVAVSADSPIPENLPDKIENQLAKRDGMYDKYNTLASTLTDLGETYFPQDENPLTATQVLAALPERLDLAKQGDAILNHWRSEALRVFDVAKVSPEKNELTEAEQRMRTRIEHSTDLEYLQDVFAEYSAVVNERHPDNKRSSDAAELPPGKEKPEVTMEQMDIATCTGRMFPKRGDK